MIPATFVNDCNMKLTVLQYPFMKGSPILTLTLAKLWGEG